MSENPQCFEKVKVWGHCKDSRKMFVYCVLGVRVMELVG